MNSRSLVWASNKSLKRVECPLFLMCWFIYGNIISCRAFGRWGNKLVVAFFSVILGVTCTINFLVLLSVKRPFAAPSPPLTLGLDTRTGDFFSRQKDLLLPTSAIATTGAASYKPFIEEWRELASPWYWTLIRRNISYRYYDIIYHRGTSFFPLQK